MSKQNIFYFTPSFPPVNNAAAIRNYWFVKTLRDDGHTVSLITGRELFFKLPKNTDGALKRLFMEKLAGVSLALKVLFSRHETYIFSSPPFLTVVIAALACRILKKNYILDIRDLYPEVFASLGLVSQKSFAYRYILYFTKIMYRNAKAVITVTKGLEDKIKKHCPSANVCLIYNGYDSELFKPNIEKFEKYTIVFHGNLGKFQRIDLLVEVARAMEKIHPQIEFKVIGYGPGEKFLKNPPQNLQYLGAMKYEDIAKFIAKCHMGISLRTDDEISREAFPVKVFEYMGVGIPVIISPLGEASQFIEKNQLGKEVENKTENIIQTIEHYIHNSEELKQSCEEFSRKNQAMKILNIINL